ncbi:MAG: AAA family ATPase [Nesterenkonia sp.]|nr:AAA family ATPase [Nesterenkonia sp.]
MSRCAVVTAGRLRTDHIAAVEGRQGAVTVERRCADLAEVVAVARAGWADAALLIGATEDLTGSLVEELRRAEVTIVVVSDVAGERGRLLRLGVCALPDEVDTDTLLAALRGDLELPEPPAESAESGVDLGAEVRVDGRVVETEAEAAAEAASRDEEDTAADGGTDAASDAPDDVSGPDDEIMSDEEHRSADEHGPDDGPAPDDEAVEPGGSQDARPRGVLTVWGAHGSPGRTTLAVNIAAELAAEGSRVLLIDADTVASSAAAHLGLLEESAGLAQACRQAELGRLTPRRLRRCATAVDVAGGRFHLLTGIPRAERWRELREHGLREVLQTARQEYDVAVVDIASPLEQDEELTFDTQAPQRHAAGLTALRCSDRVLAVGAADPVGFTRLVRALEDYGLSVPEAPHPQVVVNQVRREVVGRDPEQHLHQAWRRFGPDRPIDRLLPWDREACDGALRHGRALSEAAPHSTLRDGIAELAGLPSPRPQGLWGRLSETLSEALPGTRVGGRRRSGRADRRRTVGSGTTSS